MRRQYFDQLVHVKAKYVMLGRDYRMKKQQEADERYKQKQVCRMNFLMETAPMMNCCVVQLEKLELDRLRIQEEKEIQKRLKGLSEEDQLREREAIYRERANTIAGV